MNPFKLHNVTLNVRYCAIKHLAITYFTLMHAVCYKSLSISFKMY